LVPVYETCLLHIYTYLPVSSPCSNHLPDHRTQADKHLLPPLLVTSSPSSPANGKENQNNDKSADPDSALELERASGGCLLCLLLFVFFVWGFFVSFLFGRSSFVFFVFESLYLPTPSCGGWGCAVFAVVVSGIDRVKVGFDGRYVMRLRWMDGGIDLTLI
jgi:hypothetical protein